MRLQNTTSCTGKYYAISEQNIFTDLLCLFLLFVCVCVCLSVGLSSNSDLPPKCVNPPKCAVQIPAGGKQLLEGDFESNRSEKQIMWRDTCYSCFYSVVTVTQLQK